MFIHRVKANSDISDILKNRRVTSHINDKKRDTNRTGSSNYQKFLKKYYSLEESFDRLNSLDFVYFFREIANENGYKYKIANMKKDAHIFKVLSETYTSKEVCGMIVFLYESEQNYLDKERLSPNVLASGWINTIYADFKLWVDDKYKPKNKKGEKIREWNATDDEKSVEIGVKL